MGMMTRRNVKQRAIKKIAPAVTYEIKNTSFVVYGEKIGEVKEDVIEITNEEVIKENQFTKTEINRMSTSDLKDLAKLNGIDNAEEMTGGELKKVLIEHFNL